MPLSTYSLSVDTSDIPFAPLQTWLMKVPLKRKRSRARWRAFRLPDEIRYGIRM
jgi:hypothetical protein